MYQVGTGLSRTTRDTESGFGTGLADFSPTISRQVTLETIRRRNESVQATGEIVMKITKPPLRPAARVVFSLIVVLTTTDVGDQTVPSKFILLGDPATRVDW